MAWFAGYPKEKIEWHPTVDPKKYGKNVSEHVLKKY